MPNAFCTGVTGQDGALLSRFLLDKGYNVYGLIRRTSSGTDWRLKELNVLNHKNFTVISGDLTDAFSINNALEISYPDEVYNLGAQSYVGVSWQNPLSTYDITGIGPIRLFECVKNYQSIAGKRIKVYQASSSEMFGGANRTEILTEESKFYPRSPYGIAKCFAHYGAINYRESYNMFISCGILFNHEGPYRGLEFVTRKVTNGVARIKLGLQNKIELGNLDSVRDWGNAEDFVKAMWIMLQYDKPDDFIICTGISNSIRDLCHVAFSKIGIKDWENYVLISSSNIRPADVGHLLGSYEKSNKLLGWKPSISFEEMIGNMVEFDIERNKK